MDMKDSASVLVAVSQLNADLYESVPDIIDTNGPLVEFVATGDECAVNFVGITIFNSEDDTRQVENEETGEREPILGYLKKMVNQVACDLTAIELK